MKKIKVLRIINRFNLGGPTYNATFLTKFLGDEFETLLIGGLPEEGEADSLHILDQYGVKPVLLPEMQRIPNIQSDRKAYKRIKEIIKEFQPDIVHTHAAKAGALGRRAAKSAKVPIIVHTYHGHVFDGYFNPLKTSVYKTIERNLAKSSNAIIAISPLQKEELVNKYKICKGNQTHIVPLGFDLTKFHTNIESNRIKTRSKYKLKEDEIAIAITGRLAPIKNHIFFIEVLQEVVKKTSKSIRVFIVGDGTERGIIEQTINNYNWPNHIQFELTSWIKEIDEFNPGMDLVCLCSKNEGTPVSLIEAEAANVPVLSTDVGGVKDVVINKKTGIIVTSNTKSEYIEKLTELIEDDSLRKQLAESGWEFVKDNFHYSRLVKDVKELYFKLLKEKNVI
ncbi:MAG: glycosyltransferase [Crocinitomicaceae bacterium]|nr:glycosyltransferase [Crocinitomicaceae bacterium]